MKLKHVLVLAAAIAVGLPSYVSAQTATSATAYREQSSAAVSTPASGVQNVFIDSTTHTMYRKDSSGTVTAIGSGGGVSLPNGQIGYGNSGGTGITSDPDFSYQPGQHLLSVPLISGLVSGGLALYDSVVNSDMGGGWLTSFKLSTSDARLITNAVHSFVWTNDGAYQLPSYNAAPCAGCFNYNAGALRYSNDGVTWSAVGSGGGAISLTCGTSMSCSPSTITGTGTVSLNLGSANTWTAAQNVASVALTDGATISTNAALGNDFGVTIAGNRAMANPTNLTNGGEYQWEIIQDATGSRLITWGSTFKWLSGSAPTLKTAASSKDLISCYYDGTDLLCGTFASSGGGGGTIGGSIATGQVPVGSGTNTVSGSSAFTYASNLLSLIYNALNAASSPAISIQNNTASTSGQSQDSPMLEIIGHTWDGTDETNKFQIYEDETSPTISIRGNGSGRLVFRELYSGNTTAIGELFSIAWGAAAGLGKIFIGNASVNNTYLRNGGGGSLIMNGTNAGTVEMTLDSNGVYPATAYGLYSGTSTNPWLATYARQHAGVEQTITGATTITVNPASGETAQITLATCPTTVNGAAGIPSEEMVTMWRQPASGSTCTPGGFATGANGFSFASAAVFTPTLSKLDVYTWKWDATSSKWREKSRSLGLTQ